jgi:predicted metal-binding protein
MKKLESLVEKLEKEAKENGATFVKLIKTSKVVVKDWVREKCMFGCKGFRWHCPPFSKSPKETREFLKDYKYCLLVGFENLKANKDQKKVQLTIFKLERTCFLNGFYRAFGLTAGPCRICKRCNVRRNLKSFIKDLRKCNEKSSQVVLGALYKKFCKGIKIARPAMESWGIDVYETVRKAGGKINVVKRKDEKFRSFGLVLIE